MNRWLLAGKVMLLLVACLLVPPVIAEDSAPADVKPVAQPLSRASADKLLLDRTSIRGNQELPRVMYIVPWQESGIGDLAGRPVNSLLDEVLSPIDREVFQREVRYFEQLYGDE